MTNRNRLHRYSAEERRSRGRRGGASVAGSSFPRPIGAAPSLRLLGAAVLLGSSIGPASIGCCEGFLLGSGGLRVFTGTTGITGTGRGGIVPWNERASGRESGRWERSTRPITPHRLSKRDGDINYNDEPDQRNNRSSIDAQRAAREKAINEVIVQKLFAVSSARPLSYDDQTPLVKLRLIGQGTVPSPAHATDIIGKSNEPPSPSERPTSCIFLSPPLDTPNKSNPLPAIPIPLPSTSPSVTKSPSAILKLLSFAYRSSPISKSLCLTLNPLLINRDQSLYDNLPWNTWTIDPQLRNRDSAGNTIAKAYHLGKRDAYDRFMGRDWRGTGLDVDTLAARVRSMATAGGMQDGGMQDGVAGEGVVGDGAVPRFDEGAARVLARRVLELEGREAGMAVAEAEERLAIVRGVDSTAEDGGVDGGVGEEEMIDRRIRREEAIDNALRSVIDAKLFLLQVLDALDSSRPQATTEDGEPGGGQEQNTPKRLETPPPTNFLTNIVSAVVNGPKQAAPYHGAMGYPPPINTQDGSSTPPYSSPYGLMKEIIEGQLNADVIGCVVEDTSLFPGAVVLGGAVVLKRRGRKKVVRIDGEEVETIDEDYDFGNTGVTAGKVFVVECDCDEAIGMAMTCGLGVGVERGVWERARTTVRSKMGGDQGPKSEHIMDALPYFEITDRSIIIETQGDGIPSTSTPIQIPRTTSSVQFRPLGNPSDSNQTDLASFDTNNPIQSLSAYDELTTTDKARILLSQGSFQRQLPRPRTLRRDAEKKARRGEKKRRKTTDFDPLDRMLIPLVDESVRRRLLVREAERRGDVELASSLKEGRSRRQVAKEIAELAAGDGDGEEADVWEQEADFYGSLRADVTQDEGSYSRLMDKDAWYERTRSNLSKKLSKKKFGTLLDGIE